MAEGGGTTIGVGLAESVHGRDSLLPPDLPTFPFMPIFEKLPLAVILIGSLYWLRARARGMNLEGRQGRAIFGVFIILPALLIGEEKFFEHWHFGTYTDLLLKAVLAFAVVVFVGLFFLKPSPPEADKSGETDPEIR